MTKILAIDQGTTSSRAIVFDGDLRPSATGQMEFTQHFPKSGWVEHAPEDIWSSTVHSCKTALSGVEVDDIAAIGITNQRETVIVWDRETGAPVCNAIVWQDRRTSESCSELRQRGLEAMVSEKTGLLLDPYFSSTKIAWILSNIEGARQAAEDGRLMFGTVDSYLVWRLTGGKSHVTDATNASRTMLYNIETGDWDDDLLELFSIPRSMMPEVLDCAADFGTTDPSLFGKALPIQGVAGDQQAATVGQACFQPGMLKSTYGTGCFALLNTGIRLACIRGIACCRRSRIELRGKRLSLWRDPFSSPARWCSGSATSWVSSRRRTRRPSWLKKRIRNSESTSFPRSRDWARRTGTRIAGARSTVLPGTAGGRNSPKPHCKASRSKREISTRPWRRMRRKAGTRPCGWTAEWRRATGRCKRSRIN